MPHQLQALERLKHSNGRQLLNLCPGAGKTLTAIEYVRNMKNVLIICPASILGVWEAECAKWGATVPFKVQGTPKERERILTNMDKYGGWYVIGYEMFRKEIKRLAQVKWDIVLADECHKIKSPTSKVSKLFRKFAERVPKVVLLSGTPLINSWMDMWPQVEAIKPGALYGNWYVFRNMHAVMPIPGVPVIKGWRDVDKIKERIKPHVFTIDKYEIQRNLPPVSVVDVPVVLTDKEAKAYAQIRDELRLELEGQEVLTVANALVKVGRLRQAANGLYVFGTDVSSKADALESLVESLGDERVIVFSMYAETVAYLQKRLRCKHVITGATAHRDEIINDWKKRGTVLLGTDAMSEGLNLQDASYVINVELPWTQARFDQRIARAWRTGQLRPVTVYNLLVEDTIDYGVKKLLEKKGDVADELAAYTMEDIKKLI